MVGTGVVGRRRLGLERRRRVALGVVVRAARLGLRSGRLGSDSTEPCASSPVVAALAGRLARGRARACGLPFSASVSAARSASCEVRDAAGLQLVGDVVDAVGDQQEGAQEVAELVEAVDGAASPEDELQQVLEAVGLAQVERRNFARFAGRRRGRRWRARGSGGSPGRSATSGAWLAVGGVAERWSAPVLGRVGERPERLGRPGQRRAPPSPRSAKTGVAGVGEAASSSVIVERSSRRQPAAAREALPRGRRRARRSPRAVDRRRC